jgi:hypothetical protein
MPLVSRFTRLLRDWQFNFSDVPAALTTGSRGPTTKAQNASSLLVTLRKFMQFMQSVGYSDADATM